VASRHSATRAARRRQHIPVATPSGGLPFAGHRPLPAGSRWVCMICRRTAALQRLTATPCDGPPLRRWAQSAHHKAQAAAARRRLATARLTPDVPGPLPDSWLPGPVAPQARVQPHLVRDTGGIFWCDICGGYSVTRAVILARPCPGPVRNWKGGGRHQNLLSLRAGRHPASGALLVPLLIPSPLSDLPLAGVLPPPPQPPPPLRPAPKARLPVVPSRHKEETGAMSSRPLGQANTVLLPRLQAMSERIRARATIQAQAQPPSAENVVSRRLWELSGGGAQPQEPTLAVPCQRTEHLGCVVQSQPGAATVAPTLDVESHRQASTAPLSAVALDPRPPSAL